MNDGPSSARYITPDMPPDERIPVVGRHRRRQRGRQPAGRPRNGTASPSPTTSTKTCTALTSRRRQQAAGREVHRGDDAADDAAPGARHAGDGLEQAGERDQLRRENGQRAAPQQHRHQSTHIGAEAALEVIAERAMVCRRQRCARCAGRRRAPGRASRGRPTRPTTRRRCHRGIRDRRHRQWTPRRCWPRSACRRAAPATACVRRRRSRRPWRGATTTSR